MSRTPVVAMPIVALLLVALLAAAAARAAAADERTQVLYDDYATRLQFAYYAADVQALRRELASLAQEREEDPRSTRRYLAGFGEWKVAEVLRLQRDAVASAAAARRCVDALEPVPQHPDTDRQAEWNALLSICLRLAGEGGGGVLPRVPSRVRAYQATALKLAPRNPRVMLIAAINAFEVPDEREAAAHIRQSAAAFTATTAAFSRASGAGVGGWGEAEAWAYLGKVERAGNNRTAARDAFEHALVVAADYVEVQQLLRASGAAP